MSISADAQQPRVKIASSKSLVQGAATKAWPLLRVAVSGALFFSVPAALGAEPPRLSSYNAPIAETSVSGISSGAFMTVQFGTAWSSIVKGVGIVAGGPFYCAQASASDVFNGYTAPLATATGPCMKGPPPRLARLIEKAEEKAKAGEIDPLSHVARQKVYLFHGFNDTVVTRSVTDAAADFYRHYLGKEGAGNLFYQTTLGAGHSQVLPGRLQAKELNACAVNRSPYINQCDYDQAGVILQHIYGVLNPPNPGKLSGSIRTFAQQNYTTPKKPGELSMGDVGYVFVPRDCETGARCRVHIAFHGCKQDSENIGELFVDYSGYNAWADTNRIIVLYPQTAARHGLGWAPFNPEACWDWWSYVSHDDSYVTKSGRQIMAIKAMLDALTGGAKDVEPAALAASDGAERLVVVDFSDTAVDLAWTPVAGAQSYRISRAGADGVYRPVVEVRGPSFTDSGLQPETAYRWRVNAVLDGKDYSTALEAAATTHPKPTPCEDPGACPVRREKVGDAPAK